ncbi:hypothetical protein Tco_1299130, partial [Tanacetum coccineum]
MIHPLTDFIGEAEFVSFYLFNSIQFDLSNHNPLTDCIGEADRDPKKRNNKTGTVEKMLQVVQQEGWGWLYSGLAPSLVGTACSQVEFCKSEMKVVTTIPRLANRQRRHRRNQSNQIFQKELV